MAVHIRTVTTRGTSLGWTNGRSLTIDGSPGSQEQRVGFDAEELLGFAIGASYVTSLLQQAARRQVHVNNLAVDVSQESSASGPEIIVSVSVEADVNEKAVLELIENADKTTDVSKLLRLGVPVRVTHAHVIQR